MKTYFVVATILATSIGYGVGLYFGAKASTTTTEFKLQELINCDTTEGTLI